MSLVRLLTTGKSLVGVKDLEGRYNVTNQRLLPKFESAKNPFRPAARRTEGPPAEAAPSAPAAQAPRLLSQAGSPSAAASAAVSPVRTSQPPARSWFGSLVARLARWLTGSGRPSKRTQPAIPQFKPPMQTELRLESIKVVRNDLSDSDLEVVSSRKPAAAQAETAPAAKPAAKPEPRSKSWGRGSTRLFSAGKTLS